MASKESLENLLGSFTISSIDLLLLEIWSLLGSVTGKVEKVGFRSTRIRTFDKKPIVQCQTKK